MTVWKCGVERVEVQSELSMPLTTFYSLTLVMHLREVKLFKFLHQNQGKLRHAQLITLGRHPEATNRMSANHAATDPD